MCNLYSITTNQEAIRALFRVINRYVGNLPPMPGVFPDYPAPVVHNAESGRELTLMRWGMPPPPRTGGPPVTNIRNTSSPHITLKDAGAYITKLPKAEHDAPEWQAAMEARILVAEKCGPTMFARIGVMRAFNRQVERVFDTSRKPHHWGKRKLARDR
jgi:hypothetical protein